jgi:hypothetical protein
MFVAANINYAVNCVVIRPFVLSMKSVKAARSVKAAKALASRTLANQAVKALANRALAAKAAADKARAAKARAANARAANARAAKAARELKTAEYADEFREMLANKDAVEKQVQRKSFTATCAPFQDHTFKPFVTIDTSIADVPYIPDAEYGQYSGRSCLRTVAFAARVLAGDSVNFDEVLAATTKVSAIPATHDMFFVPIPIYTVDPTNGDTVHLSSLFHELVRYASRAGIYITESGDIVQTVSAASLDEYDSRAPLTAERLGIVLSTLSALSANPTAAVLIPDAVQWLFSLFLP